MDKNTEEALTLNTEENADEDEAKVEDQSKEIPTKASPKPALEI